MGSNLQKLIFSRLRPFADYSMSSTLGLKHLYLIPFTSSPLSDEIRMSVTGQLGTKHISLHQGAYKLDTLPQMHYAAGCWFL